MKDDPVSEEAKVFSRIADLVVLNNIDTSIHNIFAADIYAHNYCIRNYLREDDETQGTDKELPPPLNLKKVLFSRCLPFIDNLVERKDCCTMTDLTELASSLIETGEILNSPLRNRDMKEMIAGHYGERTTIAANTRANEPDLVFSADVTAEDLISKIKNQDLMREAVRLLRELFLNLDFGLSDKFCDASDIHDSWTKTPLA